MENTEQKRDFYFSQKQLDFSNSLRSLPGDIEGCDKENVHMALIDGKEVRYTLECDCGEPIASYNPWDDLVKLGTGTKVIADKHKFATNYIKENYPETKTKELRKYIF